MWIVERLVYHDFIPDQLGLGGYSELSGGYSELSGGGRGGLEAGV